VASAFIATTDQDLTVVAERPPRQRRTRWVTRAIAMLAAAYAIAPAASPSNPILLGSADDDSNSPTADCSDISKAPTATYPKESSIKPIICLSRRLSLVEHQYWPTKLEIAGLVWLLWKIQHMMESSKLPTRIYTDHRASLGIAKQTSLGTASTEHSNLRLVRASEYIQRFNIELCHKEVKDPELDLASANFSDSHTAYNYTASLVEMSDSFRQRLLDGHQQDPYYDRIIGILDANDDLAEQDRTTIPFMRDENSLIWHTGIDALRLCIPQSLIGDVLRIAHTNVGHPGAARTFERAASLWYIRRLSWHVRDFLQHCLECLVYQTRRHQPYGSLQPIQSPNVPFHTITIDFILALPKLKEGFDCARSITCKFSKRITLIPGKSSWNAKEWAGVLLDRLWIADLGLPKVILLDRDRIFLSQFWSGLFERLRVELLYSTAYHPQIDGPSERSNHAVEEMGSRVRSVVSSLGPWGLR